jgi:hypothetical protein
LVERNLAKVEVAGSNPVSRSNFLLLHIPYAMKVEEFEVVRHPGRFPLHFFLDWFSVDNMARWQSGYAADCNSVYVCSIHIRASNF